MKCKKTPDAPPIIKPETLPTIARNFAYIVARNFAYINRLFTRSYSRSKLPKTLDIQGFFEYAAKEENPAFVRLMENPICIYKSLYRHARPPLTRAGYAPKMKTAEGIAPAHDSPQQLCRIDRRGELFLSARDFLGKGERTPG